jgi:hypothetical protein
MDAADSASIVFTDGTGSASDIYVRTRDGRRRRQLDDCSAP